MEGQILLNVYFCDELKHRILEKNGMSMELVAGCCFKGFVLVPQENWGICVVFQDGGQQLIRLQDIDKAYNLEDKCSFLLIQPDPGIRCDTVMDMLYRDVGQIVDESIQHGYPDITSEGLLERAAQIVEGDDAIWLSESRVEQKVRMMAENIYINKGHVRVEDVAEAAGMSVRHVHRLFTSELGIGPKEFARRVRIRNAAIKVMADPQKNMSDYMEGLGYSDQAHFQREFKWYMGMTPGKFKRVMRNLKQPEDQK